MAIVKNDPALIAYRKEGNPRKKRLMADRLVRENVGLVNKFVHRFAKHALDSVEIEDLMQAGFIGFMHALDNVDVSKTFSTYLAFRIRHEVGKVLRKSDIISHPRCSGMPYKTYNKLQSFKAQYGRRPDAEELGVSQKKIDQWDRMPVAVSLDDSNYTDGCNLHEAVADGQPSPEDIMIDREENAGIPAAIAGLPKGQRTIVLGVLSGKDIRTVARELQLPLSWVEDTYECAVSTLREVLE